DELVAMAELRFPVRNIDLFAQVVRGHARLVNRSRLRTDRLEQSGNLFEVLPVMLHLSMAWNDDRRLHGIELAQDCNPLADVRLSGEWKRMHDQIAGQQGLGFRQPGGDVSGGVAAAEMQQLDRPGAEIDLERRVECQIHAAPTRLVALAFALDESFDF